MMFWSEQLMSWSVTPEVALGILCVSLLLLALSSHHRILSRYRGGIYLIGFGGLFYSIGNLLLGALWVWIFAALLLGLGFSMRTLLYDCIASIWIRLEGEILQYSWVEGVAFSGRVEKRSWRCIVLKDAMGRSVLVPNHHFLTQVWKTSQPGQYRTELKCWIPDSTSIVLIEEKVVRWMATAPWVAQFYGLYPDPSHPRLIVVDVSLLRFEDENKVIRALRTLIEQQGALKG